MRAMTGNTTRRGGPGFLLGLVLGVIVTVVLAFFWSFQARRDIRKGWNLVPVVVVTSDLPAGTVLAFEHLAQRQAPEQFITRSVMNPMDVQRAVGKRLIIPVSTGDFLLHSSIWSGTEQDLTACHEKNVAPAPAP